MFEKEKTVEVAWHFAVNVPQRDVDAVKEFVDRFHYLLGDGWAFEQTASTWITVDGETDYG